LLRHILAIATFLILATMMLNAVFAMDISTFQTDDITRWNKLGVGHMGSTTTTYRYESNTVKTNYSSYVVNGIMLWGTNISCTENNSSTIGLFKVSSDNIGATASTELTYYTSTNHVATWAITIYSNSFDSNTTEEKNNTIAHEIGHVYGLAHVNNSSQIMYYACFPKSVTSYDLDGMNVMTHVHTHSGSYPISYEQYTNTSHKVRCNTCRAYAACTCNYTSYHSGQQHYFLFNCICGNNQILSWPCSGNPCVQPF